MHKRLAAALMLGATLALSEQARSAPTRIAIADASDDDVAIVRLRAELEAAGYTVVDMGVWRPASPLKEVREALETAGASAAIRLGDGAVEIWLFDRRRLTLSLREVVRAKDEAGGDQTMSVRTVEAVRAELRGARHRRARGDASDTDAGGEPTGADGEAGDDRPPFAAQLGFGFSVAPGGVPPAATFVAGARWMPALHFGIGALVVASPFSATVEDREGTTAVWTGLAGAGAAIEPTDPRSSWGLVLEVGAAGGWLHLAGSAAPGFVEGTETLAVVAPYLRPSLRWRFASSFAFHLGGVGGVPLPKPVIAFAGREVASWGRPIITTSLGLEVTP